MQPARQFRRHRTNAEIAAAVIPVLHLLVSLPVLIVAAYWIKSAAGIDLMDGPSPLHFLYWR